MFRAQRLRFSNVYFIELNTRLNSVKSMEQFPQARTFQSLYYTGNYDSISSYLDPGFRGLFWTVRERSDHKIQHCRWSQSTPQFLITVSQRTRPSAKPMRADRWQLEYRGLVQMVQSREFEKVIKSQCGYSAVRIVRILSTHGDLGEKDIQQYSVFEI